MADFLSYTGTVGIQVIILFLMIGVGFIISKKGFLTSDGAAQMTNLLLYIVTPCVIISSFESMEFNKKSAGELLIAAGCAVATHVIGFLLVLLYSARRRKRIRFCLFAAVLFQTAVLWAYQWLKRLSATTAFFLRRFISPFLTFLFGP